MQMFIPLSCCTNHLTADLVSPSQNKFPLFLETHLSQSLSSLHHQDNASKQDLSLPVSLSRCRCSVRCCRTFCSWWSLCCQLPCQLISVRLAGLIKPRVTKRCSQTDSAACRCAQMSVSACVILSDAQRTVHDSSCLSRRSHYESVWRASAWAKYNIQE